MNITKYRTQRKYECSKIKIKNNIILFYKIKDVINRSKVIYNHITETGGYFFMRRI